MFFSIYLMETRRNLSILLLLFFWFYKIISNDQRNCAWRVNELWVQNERAFQVNDTRSNLKNLELNKIIKTTCILYASYWEYCSSMMNAFPQPIKQNELNRMCTLKFTVVMLSHFIGTQFFSWHSCLFLYFSFLFSPFGYRRLYMFLGGGNGGGQSEQRKPQVSRELIPFHTFNEWNVFVCVCSMSISINADFQWGYLKTLLTKNRISQLVLSPSSLLLSFYRYIWIYKFPLNGCRTLNREYMGIYWEFAS